MTTMLMERAYAELKGMPLVSEKTGELRTSVDTFRNLARAQAHLAQQLGLTPSTAALGAKPILPILDLKAYREAADAEPD